MKKSLCFFLLILLSLISCATNEIDFLDQSVQPTEEEIPEEIILDSSTPCEFNLNSVEPNSTVLLDCVLDLGGQIVILPSNVTLEYQGGDIINGTLQFDNGLIDGRLMNSSLNLEGSVSLTSSIFQFKKEKWGIVEGITSDNIALRNKEILRDLFTLTKEMGASNFEIDELDAYFLVSKEDNFPPKYRMGDIFLPSDFNLIMTDNTHLRVQPNAFAAFNLLKVYNESNVTIRGGNLHGERDEHTYENEYGEADSMLISIEAGVNVAVEGVKMYDSSGDGIIVKSIGFTFNPDYIPSHNIRISDCYIEKSRRNNISIVNGYDVIVERTTIVDAGVNTNASYGSLPKMGIDIEAYRERGANGELILYEIAKDIVIRDNVERGSVTAAIVVFIGDDTIIENNVTENSIGYSYATGVKIRNNQITGTSSNHISGIGGGSPDTETTYNNEIYGNTVKGFQTGITLYNKDAKIYDNTFDGLVNGIFIPDEVENTEIYNNTFLSNVNASKGIFAHIASANNLIIRDNTISVKGSSVNFVNVNLESEDVNNEVLISDNSLTTSGQPVIQNSNGIVLSNNTSGEN